jgi:hypothetical protein
MYAMMEMMAMTAIMADEVFERHGIEEDVFNHSIMYYHLMNDPDV